MPRLILDPELCTGCKCCELICAFARYQVNNPRKARLRILPDEKEIRYRALVCVQCPEPKCVEACPFDAIFHHPETGILKCDLCGECIPNCPNQALSVQK